MARPTEAATITAHPNEAAELQSLATHLDGDGGAVALKDALGHEVELPRSVARALSGLVRELAAGNSVTVVPTQAELTTQQAADLLNLSRPYLVRLLDANQIASSKVGTHRRVRLGDVLEYKTRRDEHREAVLARMGERVEASGLEY
ncbi:MAG: helix-turn-helix domain-containing protein [Acidimicrobiia bacterium]|nr:helix-turn-helix domain-containing protein [Acidimicrobiia bacterium]